MSKKLKGDNEADSKDKKLLLWSAVSFFLVLIVFLWLLNISSILKSKTINEEQVDNFQWEEISNTLKHTWSDFKDNLSNAGQELDQEFKKNPNIFDNNSTSTEELATTTVDVDEFEKMKAELRGLEERLQEEKIEEENNLDKNNLNNCPEWVNCMPTVGGKNLDCSIPPGCEGITEKVY